MARKQKHFEGDLCDICGIEPKRFKGYTAKGNPRWGAECIVCAKGMGVAFPWYKHRKKYCEGCGLTPFFRRALTVHHRDGDRKNNEPDNLMTLCATCHQEMEGFIFEADGMWKKAERMFKNFMNTRNE